MIAAYNRKIRHTTSVFIPRI